MNIALIPIDNRPVCYDLPLQISKLDKKYNLLLPDINIIGDLTHNTNLEELFKWIGSLKNINILIISLDTLAYGGLIPSRRSKDNLDTIKLRINRFFEILKDFQGEIYAFSSIMRISNNNINEEEKEYWSDYGKKIFEYSFNIHKFEVENNTEFLNIANAIKEEIPKNILDDYLETRNRNFQINKYFIDLKKQGLIDTLVFSKDDCAKYGLNVKEAENLKEETKGLENVYIKTGADEIPIVLLSRAINKNKKIKIAPIYTHPESINIISKYEDISVKESVTSQIELAGGTAAKESDCDLILLVNNFKNEQGELVMNIEVPLFDKELNLPEKPYFIADILNANGSDNNFINAFIKQDLKQFYGYAGWNTTGNTLGSAISAAMTYFKANIPNKEAFDTLQLIRFLDDWAYQANIRSRLRDDKENLKNDIIKKEMQPYEEFLCKKFNLPKYNTHYSFIWNRFFEIKIVLS